MRVFRATYKDRNGRQRAQQLARHSTITLTMDRYSHVEAGELSVAVANLPDLSATAGEAQRATGTDGRNAPDSVLAFCLAFSDAETCLSVPRGAAQAIVADSASTAETVRENAVVPAIPRDSKAMRLAGFEPATCGLGNRCSIP